MDDQPDNLNGVDDGRPPSGMFTTVFLAVVVGGAAFVALWYGMEVFGAYFSHQIGGSFGR
jgi:hypothetical protein